jgi:hypothetical protein
MIGFGGKELRQRLAGKHVKGFRVPKKIGDANKQLFAQQVEFVRMLL